MNKVVKMWGGFVCGKLHMVNVNDFWGGSNRRETWALFRTRAEARQQYQDVRRVSAVFEIPHPHT